MPVVFPGYQSRRFTHIEDTIDVCFEAWKRATVNTTVSQIKKVLLS